VKNVQARSGQRLNGPVSSRDLALRTHPLVFGLVLFLVSDLMIFGGLIATYFSLRGLPGTWPPPDVHLDYISAATGTALLAASSGTMLLCTHYLARNRFTIARLWLGCTIVLGAAFVLLTYHGWTKASFRIDSHAYGSVYFLTTGFHAFHVTIGVLLLVMLFFNMHKAAFERNRRAGAEAIGFFWHFVFGIWVLVWGTIFVVQ
jgi:heme/copper-type cytochrome/quinol oxidase subunit 3